MARGVVVAIIVVIGVSSAAQLQAGGPELRCFAGPEGVQSKEDARLSGLVEADIQHGLIRVNSDALSRSYFSPTTLDFLYQRECSRIEMRLESSAEIGQHRTADCRALDALRRHRYSGEPDLANRAARTIERDFASLPTPDWPGSMGPPRRVDFASCR
jgi:hypothetical protein